jgi:hypothetical protein
MCLASVIRPEEPAPQGKESLAQDLPWVSRNKRFALKGLEMQTRLGSKVRNRCSPLPGCPFRAYAGVGITQGKPWYLFSAAQNGPKGPPRRGA